MPKSLYFGLDYYILSLMTLQEIYNLAINLGIDSDPRGEDGVKRYLLRNKKKFESLNERKKKYFDRETLSNPFSDTRILFGDPKMKVRRIMAGIDADASEVLLMDRLNQKGEKIDVLISHHPAGHALASLHEVMEVQADMFADAGVPINVAHALLSERSENVKRKIAPVNHNQAVDAARLLEVPLLVIHTVWDNLGNKFMQDYLGKKKFDTVGEVFDYINEIPEFVEAIKGKAGPAIVSGSENSRAGKVIVGFTGGTSASKELYMELANAGVGTVVEMHIPEEALSELKKAHINVIDCGHMAADSIGANLFLDALGKKGVSVIPCSGLVRVKRK